MEWVSTVKNDFSTSWGSYNSYINRGSHFLEELEDQVQGQSQPLGSKKKSCKGETEGHSYSLPVNLPESLTDPWIVYKQGRLQAAQLNLKVCNFLIWAISHCRGDRVYSVNSAKLNAYQKNTLKEYNKASIIFSNIQDKFLKLFNLFFKN